MEKKNRLVEFFKMDRKEAVEMFAVTGGFYLATATVPDAPWYIGFLVAMGCLPIARLVSLLIEIPVVIYKGMKETAESEETDDVGTGGT